MDCPNASTGTEHRWYAHLIIAGVVLVRKCKMCSARRIL